MGEGQREREKSRHPAELEAQHGVRSHDLGVKSRPECSADLATQAQVLLI